MPGLFFTIVLINNAYAQQMQESLLDKIPIAQLFDSPLFFGIIIGSAVIFFGGGIIFNRYMKSQANKVEEWGKKKEASQLLDLLDSPVNEEARMAFMYLRSHADEKTQNLIVSRIEEGKKAAKINPYLFYLIEDLQTDSAVPVLQALAKGKNQAATLAANALAQLDIADEKK